MKKDNKPPFLQGIPLKKRYGQHFLCSPQILQSIVDRVELDSSTSVFEIGCGEGALTREILTRDIARLWVFEIDEDWVAHIKSTVNDDRLTLFHENILDVDFEQFEAHQPWTLLANLPYQVTFPILYKLQKNRLLLKEGVIMIQEEVAQKILKTSGRGYGYASLFFQYFFEWEKMQKIPPKAFYPPPKVDSRLLYFKPKKKLVPIPNEEGFWKFVKCCFRLPRRTLRNNLQQAHYDMANFSEDMLKLRAQQMSFDELLAVWKSLQQ